MAAKLNWGLLGTARINRAVIPPLQSSKRNHLAGVASRDAVKASAYSAEWKIPWAFGSYEAMLADPEIDVVYNSLPNSLHAVWTIKALRAGKNVLCEKPLATSLEQVDAIIQAASETGKQVAEAFMYRHHPQTLKVAELIKEGAIGKVLLMRGAFSFNLTRPEDIRNNASLDGGCLWDIGCYPISYARTMAGAEPEEVFGWQVTGESGVDRTFSGVLRFPGEVLAQVQASFDTAPFARFEIFGEEGTLTVASPYRPTKKESLLLVHNGHEKSIQVKSDELYSYEVEDMADAILDGKPARVSLADSRSNVAAILSLLESARVGKVVGVS
jgi:xylose dehydrogenase (NAD/NADP)